MSIQAQIIEPLKRLTRDHGTAVMLITHDMGVIAGTANRVAVMYAGRIDEFAPTGRRLRGHARIRTSARFGYNLLALVVRSRLARGAFRP